MAGKVTVIDRGWKEIKKKIKRADKHVVSAGIHEADASLYPGKEVHTADVAFFHEYGTIKMRSRPFVRVPLRDNRARYHALLVRAAKQMYEKKGTKLTEALIPIANQLAADIQDTALGKDILDTGQLVRSIKGKVRLRTEVK